MSKDYQIAKERINECIKYKASHLNLSHLNIGHIPKSIKKCESHLIVLDISKSEITYIPKKLRYLRHIILYKSKIIHFPIFNLHCLYTSDRNIINDTELRLYRSMLVFNAYLGGSRNFKQIIITLKYIQGLYKTYLFLIDFYSIY